MATPLTDRFQPGGPAPMGDYAGLRAALAMSPAQVTKTVIDSGLRGRGGAGFPTGQKWSFVPTGDEEPHYLVVNADEKEPGTMKDRILMERDPHQLVEGMVIAAWAVGAENAYIFLRREYRTCQERLERAIAEAREHGFIGEHVMGSSFSLDVHVHASGGRYMCGEETGLLNALEGKRAIPRNKPPFPQTSGLFGKPTVVNNAETLSNLPHILREGAPWFKSLSPSPDSGTKIFGVSGRARRPGLWELPMGVTAREILMEHAGGMQEGRTVRAFLPGGASTDYLSAEQLDVRMDFDSVAKAGSRLGTGTIVLLDDRTCPVGMVLSLETFFARESCGWCTPCREGLPWVMRALQALENGTGTLEDIETLERHARLLSPGHTYCALAPGAVEPLGSAVRLFREDFEAHVRQKGCPWR